MLLEIGIADSYGACFEGTEAEFIKENNDLTYNALHKMPSLVPRGGYTDDTQMSIAIAELLLSKESWTTELIADKFVECFQRDQRRGYTTAFLIILMNSHSGRELLSKIHGNSEKSGAAMRACPLGCIKDLTELKEKCDLQSSITHNSTIGHQSALATALATHYFYYDLGPKKDLIKWLRSFNQMNWIDAYWKKDNHVRCHGFDVVESAIYCVVKYDNLADILKSCVSFGGDTDTNAAIALGIASCSKEIKQNLPDNLLSEFENKKYGKDFLIDLDNKLIETFKR